MAIVKILTRHTPSFTSLIKYILQEGKVSDHEVISHNLKSNTITGYIKEFFANESFRKQERKDQVYLFHEILSFNANEDSNLITPEIMQDIAKEYMRLRGSDGVILGAVHRDKDHIHLHLCVSALKFRTGKSFRLSKGELQNLKISIQNFHKLKYPEISQSSPDHGKGGFNKKGQWYSEYKLHRDDIKLHVQNKVNDCISRSKTQQQFLELLRAENLHYYERNGVATGIEFEDMKFRFSRLLDDRFDQLPKDIINEERVLEEIRSLRQERDSKDKDRDYEDMERE